jgi:dTDP-4-dehydrorhamnose 3,5-epimerase
MRFTETRVPRVFLIEPEPIADERGFFARTFCREELAANGLNPDLAPGQRLLQPGVRDLVAGEVTVINQRDASYPDVVP